MPPIILPYQFWCYLKAASLTRLRKDPTTAFSYKTQITFTASSCVVVTLYTLIRKIALRKQSRGLKFDTYASFYRPSPCRYICQTVYNGLRPSSAMAYTSVPLVGRASTIYAWYAWDRSIRLKLSSTTMFPSLCDMSCASITPSGLTFNHLPDRTVSNVATSFSLILRRSKPLSL